MEGLTSGFVTSLLMGAIVAGIPLLLAGLGEQLSEKAGVLNIGLEGMMLAGAWLGFLVAWRHDSMALGLWAGAGIFVPFMTQGNGFIAIVLAMLARGVSTRGPVTARQHRRPRCAAKEKPPRRVRQPSAMGAARCPNAPRHRRLRRLLTLF